MNPYLNVWASLMNILKRFKEAHPDLNLGEVLDFDMHVDQNEFPPGILTGIYQVDYSESGQLIYVQCAFPITVPSTEDVITLKKIAGLLAVFIRNETKHQFYNHETGAIIGLMVGRDQLAISPISKTTNRQFTFVAQGFIVDRGASFQPT